MSEAENKKMPSGEYNIQKPEGTEGCDTYVSYYSCQYELVLAEPSLIRNTIMNALVPQ